MNVVALNWQLAVALVGLVVLGVVVSILGRLDVAKDQLVGAVRSIIQLGIVAFIIVMAMKTWWTSLLFVALMFGVAAWTTAKRTDTLRAWPWVCLALLAGVVPVSLIMFLSGCVPFNGPGIIPTTGIIIGNMMTAHTLCGRRSFAEIRNARGQFEAALAVGLERRDAFSLVINRILREALVPNLDTTKTVGLVTLPGAFVGVLLGGGSPLQAGAAQVLVLFGIMSGQACVVAAAGELIRRGLDLPSDLAALPR